MNSNYYNEQIISAKKNYNYFFVKMIFNILKIFSLLAGVLLINIFLNITVTNIISLVYSIYSLYLIFKNINYYTDIIRDIKNTLGINSLSFEIDFNEISYNIKKGMLDYGK